MGQVFFRGTPVINYFTRLLSDGTLAPGQQKNDHRSSVFLAGCIFYKRRLLHTAIRSRSIHNMASKPKRCCCLFQFGMNQKPQRRFANTMITKYTRRIHSMIQEIIMFNNGGRVTGTHATTLNMARSSSQTNTTPPQCEVTSASQT